MAARKVMAVALLAGVLAGGCDISRKTPEVVTLRAPVPMASPSPVPASPGGALNAPGAPDDSVSAESAATSDKSIRLFGPGINRKRQTRV